MTKQEIIDRLSHLPQGGITVKKIKGNNGKVYEYHFLQWRESGKQKSRVLKEDEIALVQGQLEERKRLEQLLEFPETEDKTQVVFSTQVRTGAALRSLLASVRGLKKRDGFRNITGYIYGNEYNKVFILYGLRRTGKTTLIKQVIADMSAADFDKAAFVQITPKDNLAALNRDLKKLENSGFKYVFIDEVTFMSDFIEGAALLSDIYAAVGMKIVLSGTDSLGFWITKSNELYDRCRLLHTTFIPYREFENVLGVRGIDNYIQYGGTMSLSGERYNESVFAAKETTDEYVDSAIAQNIQHSLRAYQYGGHFRHLYSLYEKAELTSAINRVVEDINHRFAIDVLERDFKSNDLRVSANNLRKDRFAPATVLDDIDVAAFTKRLKKMLDVKDADERTVRIDEYHVAEIKEYLAALDLIEEIDVNDIKTAKEKRIVFSQPGLRYSQAKSFIESLSSDGVFNNLSAEDRKRVITRILNEIKGRMIEDVILLETRKAKPDKNVFKLQFADGEFDMTVNDPETLETQIYEIKFSTERVPEQARHLLDEAKCAETEFRYGRITRKAVLYRGETCKVGSIDYINLEEYLTNL